MSIKKEPKKSKKAPRHPSQAKQERYLQPSILMGLFSRPSYGYELIKNIQQFGFVEGQAPPGMIYRHLRQLEEDGLVSSEWKTEGNGPAKRVYRITTEGKDVLSVWIDYMSGQAENLNAFINHYQTALKNKTRS
jgi:poly-beta-hydroxybutyrate-responsive repressor